MAEGAGALDESQTLDALLHQLLNLALVSVRANAGSLMLVDQQEGILQIKARLGIPRDARKTEPIFRVGDKGIAAAVAQEGRTILCSDANRDSRFRPSRLPAQTGPGIQSLLCVPIKHDGRVIAVINADADETDRFTPADVGRLEGVAASAGALVARKIGVLDALLQVTKHLVRMPSEGGVDAVLQIIADLAVNALGVDVVSLYQYDQEQDRFLVEGHGPTLAGTLVDPAPMRKKVYPEDVPYRIVRGQQTLFVENVHEEARNYLWGEIQRPGLEQRPRFVEREKIESMAALLLPHSVTRPAKAGDEIVGVMFANYRNRHDFNIDERKTLGTFADYAAIAILNARNEARRVREAKDTAEAVSGALAHRMNRLFNASKLAVENLRAVIPADDSDARSDLDLIERQANLLFGLASSLKKRITAAATASTGSVSLEETVQQALRDVALETQMYKDVLTIENRVQVEGYVVVSDPMLLRQIIYDLVRNSVESIQAKGAQLTGKDDRYHGKVVLSATTDPTQSTIELQIEDNGLGIEDKKLDKLFLPGSSTKGTLGIGLWWCRTHIRSTGGELVLKESRQGKGCTFALRLAKRRESPTRQPEHSPAILIVEDDEATAAQFSRLLRSLGYPVDTVHTPDHALEKLGQTAYTLLVVDMSLRDDITGELDARGLNDVLGYVRSHELTSKVIFMTAHSDSFDMDRVVSEDPRVVAWFDKHTLVPKEVVAMIGQLMKKESGS